MTSFAKRTILACTSVPALFSIIYFFPRHNHLFFSILVIFVTLVGTYEMRDMLFGKQEKPLIPPWAAALLPAVQYLELSFFPALPLLDITFVLLLVLAFAKEVFIGAKDGFTTTIGRVSRSVFLLIYPGYLSIYLIRVVGLPESTSLLFLLFLLVFGNDTFAYVFGMLFGRKNRNILAASPNKSIAGFIGGSVSAILIGLLWVSLVPSMKELFTPLQGAFMGVVISLACDIGDLIESVFKRGAKVKDSGTIMIGRGGLMDSIDSLIVSAPFFIMMVGFFI